MGAPVGHDVTFVISLMCNGQIVNDSNGTPQIQSDTVRVVNASEAKKIRAGNKRK